jgi:HEAT repeat protein
VVAAAERLIAERKTRRLTELLDQAPQEDGAVDRLWDRLLTPILLRQELKAQPTDFALVERFAMRMADSAADPLLDALASADDRSARWNLIRILTALGRSVAPAIAARLPDAPWFVQRNLLVLLGRLGNWPDEFSPSQYTSHREARVRREAYRLMVETASTRDAAIREGLADPDPTIVAMMLRAAATGCPAGAIPLIERVLREPAWSLEVRLLAIRVIGSANTPTAGEHLLSLVRRPRRWWWGSRLAPKSPVLLAALKALADGWASDPKVVPVLTQAARHRDPEIRASVGGPGT